MATTHESLSTTATDKAVGEAITKLQELTPEMFNKLHEAYSATLFAESLITVAAAGTILIAALLGLVALLVS